MPWEALQSWELSFPTIWELSGYGGCVWARPRTGGQEAGMCRNGCNVRTLVPGGGIGLSLFHPLSSPLWQAGRAWEGRETSFGKRAEAEGSLKRLTLSVNPLTENPGWAKPLLPPSHKMGGAQNLDPGNWVSSYWFTV